MTLGAIYRSNATRDTDARWYHGANAELAERALALNVDVDTFAGIVAALSPQTAWDNARHGRPHERPNLDIAERFVATGANVHTSHQVAKARAILDGADPLDTLRGPKERAFYLNLSRPGATDAVTVDRWAARAVGAPERLTARTYERVADTYRRAAKRIGISPDALQAAVWAEVRRA